MSFAAFKRAVAAIPSTDARDTGKLIGEFNVDRLTAERLSGRAAKS
jgi:hypothetical protein